MIRFPLVLALGLAACSTGETPAHVDARPMVAREQLQGRWAIISVDGRASGGLWLEFGGEGLATITSRQNAIFVALPQPRTRAFLGCNNWYPSGWTPSGDKLILGVAMSHRTERGCDADRMVVDDKAYAILRRPMTMESTSRNRLRLTNEKGELELVRNGS
jgi:heat shock protein HslJ